MSVLKQELERFKEENNELASLLAAVTKIATKQMVADILGWQK